VNVKVQREFLTSKSTIGRLFLLGAGGQADFQCYTLEPVQLHEDVKPRAIPSGTYELTLRNSPKHGRLIPHVENVPGFSEIEMHIGNFPRDTEGCTLVGKTREVDSIGLSHAAFDALFEKLLAAASEPHEGVQHVGYITYVDPGK
jgi:hypothetical protein